jgi:hypothetical protein
VWGIVLGLWLVLVLERVPGLPLISGGVKVRKNRTPDVESVLWTGCLAEAFCPEGDCRTLPRSGYTEQPRVLTLG